MDRPDAGQFFFKPFNPKASQSDTRVVRKRPESATMSALSIQENKRQMEKKILANQDPLLKSFETLKRGKMSQFSMPESEISKMLVRLDRITRNTMYGQKKVELRENEKISVELFAGESQFAYVNTRGETCPLNITIKRITGLLEVFVSRKIKEPTKILNDEVHIKDYIKITDKSFFFITPFVAFNFTAVKDSNFSVSIKFGQNNVTRSLRCESASQGNLLQAANQATEEDLPKKKPPEKNFIKLNATLPSFKIKNFKTSDKKRHEVIERHRNLMIEAHERKIFSMKKNEIRLDAEVKGKEIIEVLRRKQNFEKFWITLTKLGVSLLHLRKVVREKRSLKLKELRKKTAARKLQKKFREYLQRHPVKESLLIMALASLKNFHRVLPYLARFYKKKIVDCIGKARKNSVIKTVVGGFTEKIILIQRIFRDYMIAKEIRMEELNECWVRTLTKRLEKIHSYKKKTKKWKKKQIEKYSSITEEIKKRILGDHLINGMKKYLEILKEFRSRVTEKLSISQRLRYLESEVDPVNYLCPPLFKYIPTYKEMLSLIDLVVGSGDDGD